MCGMYDTHACSMYVVTLAALLLLLLLLHALPRRTLDIIAIIVAFWGYAIIATIDRRLFGWCTLIKPQI